MTKIDTLKLATRLGDGPEAIVGQWRSRYGTNWVYVDTPSGSAIVGWLGQAVEATTMDGRMVARLRPQSGIASH